MNFRYVSVVLVCILAIVYHSFAQTDGPIQREFVGSSGVTGAKVDEFTGDFNFGIPIITVPGSNGFNYSLNLTYKSGASPAETASWVGFGWSLSPGAIIRGKNGFPDDYKGAKIRKWNKIKPNISVSIGPKAGLKAYSFDLVNINSRLYYNNYKGYQITNNFGLLANLLRISWDERNGYYLSNYTIDPLTIINIAEGLDKSGVVSISSPISLHLPDLSLPRPISNILSSGAKGAFHTNPDYTGNLFPAFSGSKVSGEISVSQDILQQFGSNLGCLVTYDEQNFIDSVTKFAYGSMYSSSIQNDDVNAIMDFSSDRSSIINSDNQYLPIPYGGEDNFIITGSGMSGSFKFHDLKYGDYHPQHEVSSTGIGSIGATINLGVDWGEGGKLSAGFYQLTYGAGDNFTPHHEYTKGDGTEFFLMNGDLGYQEYYDNASNLFHDPIRASVNTDILSSWFSITEYDLVRNIQSKGSYSIDYVTRKEIANDIKQFITGYGNDQINTILYSAISDGNEDWLINSDDQIGLNYYPQFSSFEKKPFQLFRQWSTKDDIWRYYPYEDDQITDEVEEFQITNPNGSIYVYGQPVYARNERDLSYGVDLFKINNPNSPNLKIYQNLTTANADKITGYESEQPYVCAYLLTQILSPDYVDLTMNGPSPDDLGDYVKFNYKKIIGTPWKTDVESNQWSRADGFDNTINPDTYWNELLNNCSFYKWRFPYNGLDLYLNSLSNNEDDYAHVQMGEREVYYLESIETKTHIAYFINNMHGIDMDHPDLQVKLNNSYKSLAGSHHLRCDGLEASHYEMKTTGESTSNFITNYHDQMDADPELIAANKMRILERIELYQKDPNDPTNLLKLVNTTRFEYNYNVWPGSINSINNVDNDNPDKGRLTLKKLWFESNNVKKIDISPYYFDYKYPDNPTSIYPSQYPDLPISTLLDETPDCSLFNVDRWGNYMDSTECKFRRSNLKNYVPQFDNSTFDPAAWNLKQITLPGGAQIHVQYEQKDYLYVQDRRATVMAPISGYASLSTSSSELTLDMPTLQSQFQAMNKDTLLALFKKEFLDDGKLLYCRFLHDFFGTHLSTTDLWGGNYYPYCSEEYIDTYVKVNDVQYDAMSDAIKLTIDGDSPWNESCKDYYFNNKISDVNDDQACYGNYNDLKEGAEEAIHLIISALYPTIEIINSLFNPSTVCTTVNTNLSYIKIPVPNRKLGGGVRVKRLLYLDQFNKNIQSAIDNDVYGYEYVYKDIYGRSSGVATNEPAIGKEENSLIEPLNSIRNDHSYADHKYASGDFLVKYMGPIGQSLLPSPSVGYSRVLVKNIFEGETDQGLSINEYYTCKDFPFDMNISDNSGKLIKANQNTDVVRPDGFRWENYIYYPYVLITDHETKLAQGYQFILNSMNGKLKKSSILGGRYINITYPSSSYADDLEINLANHVSSETSYEYFQPGESIPMFYGFKNIPDPLNPGVEITENDIRMEYPGRRIDLCSESTKITNTVGSEGLDLDVTIGFTAPPAPVAYPMFTWIPNITLMMDDYQTYVTNKTISYPAIIKEVQTTTEGVTSKMQNVAFDPRTGMPVIQRGIDSYDSLVLGSGGGSLHDGAYYNYTFLASTQYPNFTQINESEKFYPTDSKEKFLFNRRTSDYELQINSSNGSTGCNEKFFSNGDFLRLKKQGTNAVIGYFWVEESTPNLLKLVPLFNHDYSGTFSFSGTSFDIPVFSGVNTIPVDIEVLKSGRNNILGAPAGSLTTYGQTDDTKPISGYTFEPKPPVKELDSYSTIQKGYRENFIDQLNTELLTDYNYMVTNSLNEYSWTWTYGDGTYPVELIDDNGEVKELDGSDAAHELVLNIYAKRSGGKITFEIAHQYTSKPIKVTYLYDELAADLNNWLDKSWNINIAEYINRTDWNLSSGCEDQFDPTCDKLENQKFINKRINLLWPKYRDDGLGNQIHNLTGLTQIMNKSYLVDGKFKRGSAIFKKNITLPGAPMSVDPDLDNGLTLIVDNSNLFQPRVFIGTSWLFIDNDEGYNIGFSRHFNEYGNFSDPYYALAQEPIYTDLFIAPPSGSDIINIEDEFNYSNSYTSNPVKTNYLDYSDQLDGLSRQKSDAKNFNRILEPVQKVNDFSTGVPDEKSLFTWHKAWIKPPLKVLNNSDFIDNGSEYFSGSNYVSAVNADNDELLDAMDTTNQFTSTYGHFIISGTSPTQYLSYEVLSNSPTSHLYHNSSYPFQDHNENWEPSHPEIKRLLKLQDENTEILNQCSFEINVDESELSNPAFEVVKLDASNYQFTYINACCNSNVCISFPDVHYDWKFDNVVSSSAATYSDDWENNFSLTSLTFIPDYFNKNNAIQEAKKSKWRSNKNLVYSSLVTSSGNVGTGTTPIKGYDNSGLLEQGCTFNWNTFNNFSRATGNPYTNYGWFVNDSITKRDRHGRVVESVNSNGVYSSVKYDELGNNIYYAEALPSIQAMNADTNEIFFESFESYPSSSPGIGAVILNNPHTGRKSKEISLSVPNMTNFESDLGLDFTLNNPIPSRECDALVVDLWIKAAAGSWLEYADQSVVSNNKIYFDLSGHSPTTPYYGELKAIVNQWALLEFTLDDYASIATNTYDLKLYTPLGSIFQGQIFFIDDIRIIPACATANCFVYDSTDHKLSATLDNDHFATIYQYNYENSPVRVIAETYKGLKTVTESQANILKNSRSESSFQPPSIQPINNYWNNFNNGAIPDQKDQKIDEKFDIFNIKITPKGKQMKIFDKKIELQKTDSTNNKVNEKIKTK